MTVVGTSEPDPLTLLLGISDQLWLFRKLFIRAFQRQMLTYYLQLCQLADVCRQRLKVVITQVESTQGRWNTVSS